MKWKPGQSGNPKGRPKRERLETLIEQSLDQPASPDVLASLGCEPDAEGNYSIKSRRDALVELFSRKLEAGDDKAWALYIDRVWPKVNLHDVTVRDEDADSLDVELDTRISRVATGATDGSGRELH